MNENTAMLVVVLVLAILFGGDPDLMDAIIHYLMK